MSHQTSNNGTVSDVSSLGQTIDSNHSDSQVQLTAIINEYYFGLNGVGVSIVCGIGVITNLMNIIVLSAAVKKKNFVTYKIFLCMAVADFLTMVVTLSYSAGYMAYQPVRATTDFQGVPPNLTVSYSYYFWGQTYFYFTNYTMFLSNWMAVLMNLFRLLAVTFPLKSHILASKLSVNISIAALALLGIIAQIPLVIAVRIAEHGELKSIEERVKYSTISILLIDVIPLFTCLFLTIMLTIQLALNKRERRTLGVTSGSHEQKSITLTLIITSVFFILMNLSNIVYWTINFNERWNDLKISLVDQVLFYNIAALLMYVGYASNFFIYVAGNASFRKDLMMITGLKKCLSRKQTHTTSGRSQSASTLQTNASDAMTTTA